MRVLYPSNFAKLTLFFRARTNARPLSASVIVCASLKGIFLVVYFMLFLSHLMNKRCLISLEFHFSATMTCLDGKGSETSYWKLGSWILKKEGCCWTA